MHHVALICKNGHIITGNISSDEEKNDKFCEKCGSETISECTHCAEPIRGDWEGNEDFIGYDTLEEVPMYCRSCGTSFPWTQERVNALKEMIEFSEIDEADKTEFNNNIELIVSDTPRTKLAAMKIKKVGGKIAQDIWDGVAKPLIVEIASETAKKTMGF